MMDIDDLFGATILSIFALIFIKGMLELGPIEMITETSNTTAYLINGYGLFFWGLMMTFPYNIIMLALTGLSIYLLILDTVKE